MAVLECPECHLPLTDMRPWLTGNYVGDPCERGTCPQCHKVWLQNPTTGAMKLVRLEARCPVCDSPFVVRQQIGTITVSACPNHPQYSSVGDCSNTATPEQPGTFIEKMAIDPCVVPVRDEDRDES